jgi:hypothetical protein
MADATYILREDARARDQAFVAATKNRQVRLMGEGDRLKSEADAGPPAMRRALAGVIVGLTAACVLAGANASQAVAEEVAPAAEAAPKLDIPARIEIDEATQALFPKNAFLLETGTPHRPKSCDGLIDRVYWVNIQDHIRSYLKQDDISVAEFVAGFLTFGLSAFQGPEDPHWTIFSATTEGRYITFLLGQPRGYWDEDKVGPQTRLTYYKLDAQGKRLALVETTPVDAPPFARPAKGVPKYKTVHLRCVYRPSGGNAP